MCAVGPRSHSRGRCGFFPSLPASRRLPGTTSPFVFVVAGLVTEPVPAPVWASSASASPPRFGS